MRQKGQTNGKQTKKTGDEVQKKKKEAKEQQLSKDSQGVNRLQPNVFPRQHDSPDSLTHTHTYTKKKRFPTKSTIADRNAE